MRKTADIGTVWRTPYGDILRLARVEKDRVFMEPIEVHTGYIYNDDDGTIPFFQILDTWKRVEEMEF